MEELQYIILNGKAPIHKFKNGEGAKTWDEVKGFSDLAVIVPEGYIVLDFDDADDAAIMLDIVQGEGLMTRVMKTTRGVHCWFKIPEGTAVKNAIKSRLAIGIMCDKKAGGRNAYVKIKQDGSMRDVIKPLSLEDCQEMPKWLSGVSCPNGMFEFKNMGEGSGRNQELFNYIVYLQNKGFDHDEIKQTIEIINCYVLNESLSDSEIQTICRDEAFVPDEVIEEQQKKRVGFQHNEFGDQLIQEFNIIENNGVMYVYDDGYYQADDRIIEQKMIELFPSIKQKNRNEVLSYLRIKTHVPSNSIHVNPYILNLKNTRLDIRTNKCLEFDPKFIEFDRVPVTYDPSAYCADVDKILNRVFKDDKDLIQLFDEMVGYCLIKHSRFEKAFLFHGSGSNGKSTILGMLKHFLGAANYSSISLENVAGRFNTVELENKLANIGDDIDNTVIKDTGTLKKVFSGQDVMVERKGERPYTIEPTATHIYSCNSLPRSFDKSDGFYRRLIMIPFDAKFSPTDEDFDPMIEGKITTDEAMSYLLNRAIKGAQRLIKRNKFTLPASVIELVESYKADNSTVMSWIEDKEITEEHCLTNPKDDLYAEFVAWCKTSGIKVSMISGKKTFYREVENKFGFDKKALQKADKKRYFKYSLD